MEQALDDQATIADAAMRRIANRLNTLQPEHIPITMLSQLLRTVSDIQLRALGHDPRVALTGPGGGPIEFVLEDLRQKVGRMIEPEDATGETE